MHVLSRYTTVVGLHKLFSSRKYLLVNKVLTAVILHIYCYWNAPQLYDKITVKLDLPNLFIDTVHINTATCIRI
jgi:hypothetical protein